VTSKEALEELLAISEPEPLLEPEAEKEAVTEGDTVTVGELQWEAVGSLLRTLLSLPQRLTLGLPLALPQLLPLFFAVALLLSAEEAAVERERRADCEAEPEEALLALAPPEALLQALLQALPLLLPLPPAGEVEACADSLLQALEEALLELKRLTVSPALL